LKISVIIPVHNSEIYVAEAVQSALAQTETTEVILVEDGSSDGSLARCRRLRDTNPRIRLFTHPFGVNRGASASRNLGIQNAQYNYIAFLDADDFYLANRFSATTQVFAHDETVEGVYEAIGTYFVSDEAERRWRELQQSHLTTIRSGIPPEVLFREQSPIGCAGHCSLNGLTVRRSVFDKTGRFDTDLAFGEDTAFFMKLAACATLRPGQVQQPVAMRRLHANNTVTRARTVEDIWRYRLAMWLALYRWLKTQPRSAFNKKLSINKMLWECYTITDPHLSLSHLLPLLLRRLLHMLHHEPAFLAERTFTVSVLKHFRHLAARHRS